MNKGLYRKYIIQNADGQPTDSDAQYFVLRIDTDRHARVAMQAYVDSVRSENGRLAWDIAEWLIETTPRGGP